MILCTRCQRREAANFPQEPDRAACWACIDRERLLAGPAGAPACDCEDKASPLWAVALAMLMWALILGVAWALC